MLRKTVSGLVLTVLLVGMLTLTFNVQLLRASGTIYIRPDGTIEPPTPCIQRDGNAYTFTCDIHDSIVVEKNDIVVDGAGYTIEGTGSGTGIFMNGRTHVTIKNMEIKGFSYGVRIYQYSNHNTIIGCNITNNNDGVWLGGDSSVSGSSYNRISENIITANNFTGIWIECSSNYNEILENIITNNDRCGIELEWYNNYNNISKNTITNNANGILHKTSSNSIISGNNITESTNDGIWFHSSYNSTISGNNITNNTDYGIYIRESSNITIHTNDLITNEYKHIIFDGFSNSSSIYGNTLVEGKSGIDFWSCSHNMVSKNNITNSNYGITLHKCLNHDISENNITNSKYVSFAGIVVGNSSLNSVYRNHIVGDNLVGQVGISVRFSSSNLLYKNKITDCYYGISVAYSTSNEFYHNNLIDNTHHANIDEISNSNLWDDGYPSGGNYWSDYTGADNFWGENQDLKGCDLIGDTAYVIDGDNIDNYPLMNPWRECKPPVTEFPDINGDGTINIIDIAIVAIHFGETLDP